MYSLDGSAVLLGTHVSFLLLEQDDSTDMEQGTEREDRLRQWRIWSRSLLPDCRHPTL